ncbi:MAG TPA: phosphate ABC transporter substrate-binding protein [Nitrosomonas halophila]|nr:phosphate ABC transporter substrate-binding protein [Nitrosomonas halophila]
MAHSIKAGFVLLAFWLAGQAGGLADAQAAAQKLLLTGSSTIAPLMSEIGRRYESLHPGVRIDIQTGGSSRGIQDVRRGVAAIGMVSRALKPDEQDLQAYTIALDSIGIVLHASNPLTMLTREQITAIYRGQITHWQAVGGAPARITVVNKAEGRSTLELFLDHFNLKNSEIKPHAVIGDNQQGIKTIAGNPHAIGYLSIGAVEYAINQGVAIKLLPLARRAASAADAIEPEHSLTRPLNLVTPEAPQGLVRDFIEFARSAQVHDLVEAQHFIPASLR